MRQKIFNLLLAAGLLVGPPLVPPLVPPRGGEICGGETVFLPLVVKGATMANTDIIESIESLKEKPARTELDGVILAIFEESATIQIVGSNEIRSNVALPQHVNSQDLQIGQHVKLGYFQGQPIVLAVLDALDEAANYSGLGYPLPTPPQIHVYATQTGWVVEWAAVAGADRYHVYRNDTADSSSPDDLGYITETSLIVPYEAPFIYFAVATVAGLNESEVSGWVTDDQAAPVPDTFAAGNAIGGHLLTISGDDPVFDDLSLKCLEIQIANDGSGTGAASLGNFYATDFPYLKTFGEGVVKWYRIRSIDWAGNTSDWTDWDEAWVLAGSVKDLFDGYGGSETTPLESLWWWSLLNMDSGTTADLDGTQGDVSDASDHFVDGDGSLRFETTHVGGSVKNAVAYKIVSWDLTDEGRFTDDDYVIFPVYVEQLDSNGKALVAVRFWTAYDTDFFWSYEIFTATGWYFLITKKDDFDVVGSPDWSNITAFGLYIQQVTGAASTPTVIAHVDDLRIVKADPDDATAYNDTGKAWDKAAHTGSDVGEWHIYEGNRTGEPGKPYSYGQIKTDASPAVWYLSHKPLTTTQITSTVQAGVNVKDNDGLVGLAFFVKDVTADSWDMYVLEADSSGDTITLAKYVGGTRTQIAQASFTFDPDEILWLGADFKDYDSDGGRIKVYASLSEGNLIQAANLILSEQDTEWVGDAGGSVGVLSKQANARFVNFVAGSPAHAETADVAFALDGTIVAGETKRVRYNRDDDVFEWSEDGQTWTPVEGGTDPAGHDHSKLVGLDGSPDPALSADADGYLMAAVQPVFSAYVSANVPNVTGDGTAYTMIPNTEIEDRDGNYNPATGVFTAPVDGYYPFKALFSLYGISASHTQATLQIVTSNRTYQCVYPNPGAIAYNGYFPWLMSVVADMDAGDTAYLVITIFNGAKTASILGGNVFFQGYLLP